MVMLKSYWISNQFCQSIKEESEQEIDHLIFHYYNK